jgi:prevent-host-death family protein
VAVPLTAGALLTAAELGPPAFPPSGIRAVAHQGPQIITRHGDEVAVVVDIAEYRRLIRPTADRPGLLLGGPALSDDAVDVLAEVEAEGKADFGRQIDVVVGL